VYLLYLPRCVYYDEWTCTREGLVRLFPRDRRCIADYECALLLRARGSVRTLALVGAIRLPSSRMIRQNQKASHHRSLLRELLSTSCLMTTGSLRGNECFIKCFMRLGIQINLLLLISSIADLFDAQNRRLSTAVSCAINSLRSSKVTDVTYRLKSQVALRINVELYERARN